MPMSRWMRIISILLQIGAERHESSRCQEEQEAERAVSKDHDIAFDKPRTIEGCEGMSILTGKPLFSRQ